MVPNNRRAFLLQCGALWLAGQQTVAEVAQAAVRNDQADSRRWPDEQQFGAAIVHADFRLTEIAPLLGEIEQLQVQLHRDLQLQPNPEWVHLFLFQRRRTYENYLKRYFPKVPSRRALFIKGDGPGMVFAWRHDQLDEDLRHECTHAFLHRCLPMVPLWLDEGLAEYYEVPELQRPAGHEHLGQVRWQTRFGRASSLEKLESIANLSELDGHDYRDAWAWVHWMLHSSPTTRDLLLAYLADIQRQQVPGRLSDRLQTRLGSLESSFVQHFRTWK